MGRLGHRVSGRKPGEPGYGKPVKKKRRLGNRVGSPKAAVYRPGESPAEVAAVAADVDEVVEAPITANLSELEEALELNPAYYETLFATELAREGGARKGALRHFLAHEEKHEAREDRIAEITVLL